MTGSSSWLWLPDLSNDLARQKVAQHYTQSNREHWIKAFSCDASPARQGISEATKDPLQLLSCLSVICGLALGGRDSRQAKQGYWALHGLIQSQSEGRIVTSTVFFVAFVHAVAYHGAGASSMQSLQSVCDALLQDSASTREHSRISLTDPSYTATLGHLLAIMGARPDQTKDWPSAVSTTAKTLKSDVVNSQSCAAIAAILEENLKAALGSDDASSKGRDGQSGAELFAKGPMSNINTSEAGYKAQTTAAIHLLAAATLTWSRKSMLMKIILSCAGSDRSSLLKQLIAHLIALAGHSGPGIPRDVLSSVVSDPGKKYKCRLVADADFSSDIHL